MFHYLNQSNCFELEGFDESKEYRDTRRAMDIVGISSCCFCRMRHKKKVSITLFSV